MIRFETLLEKVRSYSPEADLELLRRLGARPVDVASELTELVPRMQGRPRRG